jgi:hypothetical protein
VEADQPCRRTGGDGRSFIVLRVVICVRSGRCAAVNRRHQVGSGGGD